MRIGMAGLLRKSRQHAPHQACQGQQGADRNVCLHRRWRWRSIEIGRCTSYQAPTPVRQRYRDEPWAAAATRGQQPERLPEQRMSGIGNRDIRDYRIKDRGILLCSATRS
jgi:hypothetical protein